MQNTNYLWLVITGKKKIFSEFIKYLLVTLATGSAAMILSFSLKSYLPICIYSAAFFVVLIRAFAELDKFAGWILGASFASGGISIYFDSIQPLLFVLAFMVLGGIVFFFRFLDKRGWIVLSVVTVTGIAAFALSHYLHSAWPLFDYLAANIIALFIVMFYGVNKQLLLMEEQIDEIDARNAAAKESS